MKLPGHDTSHGIAINRTPWRPMLFVTPIMAKWASITTMVAITIFTFTTSNISRAHTIYHYAGNIEVADQQAIDLFIDANFEKNDLNDSLYCETVSLAQYQLYPTPRKEYRMLSDAERPDFSQPLKSW